MSAEKKISGESKPKQAPKAPAAKAAMRGISIEKITLNIGTGKETEKMERAIKLLTVLTGRKPIKTITQKRIPTWGVRPGLPLGLKVTLRRQAAVEVLKRLFEAKEKKINGSGFGSCGDVAFGVHEYVDIPGLKYDPAIGVMGFDVCITLQRAGFRIKRRRQMAKKIPGRHRITRDEALAYMKSQFGIEIES